MNTAKKIDVKNGTVILSDGNKKTIDNYILELEDRLIAAKELLIEYEDVDANSEYLISGETLFEVMDILENRK